MSKVALRSEQNMTDAVYVDECADWARRLTHTEARGPGDIENAWRRLEVRYGIPWRSFWAFRYRKPKQVATALYFRLQAAHEDARGRQIRQLRREIEITKAKAGSSHRAVVAAEAVLREDDGEVSE